MTIDDVAAISRIDAVCFHTAWSDSAFRSELLNEHAFYNVAIFDDVPIGFSGMWIILDEVTINRVAVLPDYRCQGIGAMLLHDLLDKAVEQAAEAATLEVRMSNSDAIKLYTKFGFESEGVRKRYYEDTGEDALIMWNRNINRRSQE